MLISGFLSAAGGTQRRRARQRIWLAASLVFSLVGGCGSDGLPNLFQSPPSQPPASQDQGSFGVDASAADLDNSPAFAGFAVGFSWTSPHPLSDIKLIDLNNDQRPDIIVSDAGDPPNHSGGLQFFYSDNNGSFTQPEFLRVGCSAGPLAIGDFNGDGTVDVVVERSAPPSLCGDGLTKNMITVLRRRGGAPAMIDSEEYLTALATGDFDGDGVIDLAGIAGIDLRQLRGAGDGSFEQTNYFRFPHQGQAVVTADFNRDGWTDVALAIRQIGGAAIDEGVELLLGSRDGISNNPVRYMAGGSPYSLVAADLNHDDNMDLVIDIARSMSMSVLYGNGDGTFTAARAIDVGGFCDSIVAADFNGDSNTDVLVGCYDEGSVQLVLGTGAGTFYPPKAIAAPHGVRVLGSADADNDGDQDLFILSGNGPATMAVLVNQTH